MTDMVERVARAMCAANGTIWGGPRGEDDPDFLLTKIYHMNMARAAIEATEYATLEAALRTIQSSIPGYLKQKMTAEDFALIVIGAVDSKAVNQAFGRGADNQDAPLSPIEASVPPAKP